MSIIPGDVQCIAAHGLNFLWLGWLLIHGQKAGSLLGSFPGIAMMRVPFFSAGSTWACVTQPLEAEMGLVAVVPFNIHPGAGGYVDLDRFRIDDAHTVPVSHTVLGATWIEAFGFSRSPVAPGLAAFARLGWDHRLGSPGDGDHACFVQPSPLSNQKIIYLTKEVKGVRIDP